MDDKSLKVRHIAEMLECSRDTVLRYERVGIIPKARRNRINGYREWRPREVQEALRQIMEAN